MKTKSSYLITATIYYGPYSTKVGALLAKARACAVKASAVGKIEKVDQGFIFVARTSYEAPGLTEKIKAVAALKKAAPEAQVTVTKI
ncbi:MAG: hypothetical protein M0R51_16790 [Clostridia bacterium]|jgi:hypothetical protein|nr:hypothetical protein [Clostridia bacterium]